MNLWVKRTGQLLLAALFLMACEDESSLLGFKNPKNKFDVNFVDIPLESSVVLIDSIRTDNLDGSITRLLVGKYFDPIFGEVSSTSFVQLRPDRTDTISTTSVYDSLVLEMQLDFYAYGANGIAPESLSIHEITEDSIVYSVPIKPYYFYNSLGYGPSMGESTYSINYDSLKKQSALTTPTTTFSVRIKLNENTDFNQRLFNLIKDNVDDQFSDPKKFRYAIKGLALTAGSTYSSIVGFTGSSLSKTRLTLHYHTPTDTLTRLFYLDVGSFSNIQTNRTGDLAGFPFYESVQPSSDLRYVQNGSPVITRIDLNNFYEFIKDVPKTLINSAELVIDDVENPGVYTPPAFINLRTMKENNLFHHQNKTADTDLLSKYWVIRESTYFLLRSDISSGGQPVPVSLSYKDGKYSGNMTLFAQNLIQEKDADPKLRYVGLYSLNTGKTVNRVAFNKNAVKLRLYYTVPTNQ